MKPSIPQPPRYSSRPFPPYRHRPGQTPHPVLDPAGHLYGQEEEPVAPFDPDKWHQSEDYLYGVDLFNHGYYWAAHEAWEGLWKSAPPHSLSSLFLRGMIQLAAALLQREMGKLEGMRSLSEKGLKKLRKVAGLQSVFCGVELDGCIYDFEAGRALLWISRNDATDEKQKPMKRGFRVYRTSQILS